MGSTLPALKERRGDFEDWIIQGAGLSGAEVQVVDVPSGQPFPEMDGRSGVIITGSHSMVTERLPWSERAAQWVREAVARDVAVLGICYGHQLLAHALGGAVGNNPHGSEVGTAEVVREGAGAADRLLGTLPARFTAHESHTQSVLSLPAGAVRLASNGWDANQAFRIGGHAWGVQFHPEFDAQIMTSYIQADGDLLSAEGQDVDERRANVKETPLAASLLRRFADLCRAAG